MKRVRRKPLVFENAPPLVGLHTWASEPSPRSDGRADARPRTCTTPTPPQRFVRCGRLPPLLVSYERR